MDMFLAAGGNFRLNVGPKADGTIPEESRKLMAGVGDWRKRVGDAFKNVEIAKDVLSESSRMLATRRGNSLFIHFPDGMNSTGFYLHELETLPKRAILLNTGAALKAELDVHPRKALESDKRTLHIWGIPADAVANECAVVRLDF
jgi:alpha-L-fucosidase